MTSKVSFILIWCFPNLPRGTMNFGGGDTVLRSSELEPTREFVSSVHPPLVLYLANVLGEREREVCKWSEDLGSKTSSKSRNTQRPKYKGD